MTLLREMIRVQKDNAAEIGFELERIQCKYPTATIELSNKPIEIVDQATQDCNMWIDVIW